MRALIAVALSFAAIAPAAPAMDMGTGSPEHVAAALAALEKGHDATARKDLKLAIKTMAEPAKARDHAKEALAALDAGKHAMAIMHATNGAAVEHLTYALQAVEANKDATAKGHLMEAAQLAPVAKQANAAIAALGRHDRAAAIRHIRAGLAKTND